MNTANMNLDITNFNCLDIGVNLVTLSVTDESGNTGTCQASVTVVDLINPVVVCPADVIITAAAGQCDVVVNSIGPVSTSDNCGANPVTYRLEGATVGSGEADASGTTFNKGVTTVWYRITDPNGNADSCSFNVNDLS